MNAFPARPAPSTTDWPPQDLEALGTCPVCGSPSRALMHSDMGDRLFSTPGRWTLWRCGGCHSAYLDPRPDRSSIGRAYETYVTHEAPAAPPDARGPVGHLRRAVLNGYLNRRFGYRLRPAIGAAAGLVDRLPYATSTDRFVRHLHFRGSCPTVLDFGCGNADFLLLAEQLGWDARGVDFDEKAVALARDAGLAVNVGGLEAADRPDGGFDAITLGHVIEHLHDPVAFLSDALSALRPGGMIWLATPNVESLGHRTFGSAYFGLDPPRHLVLFNRDSLEDALRRAGFEDIEPLRPGPDARWLFGPSLAIARGRDPLTDPPALPAGLRLKQAMAEAVSRRRPRAAEELIMAAWAPPGR
ncbi:MAG: class I SAM-dependent methyltransferase [Actinomycetota bacterium]|nr:class I SAM-dependent methyltransferase [Actinomycetota bacterium]